MKKILALLVTLSTALCAYADDLTFSINVEGSTLSVTPSNDDQLYLCAPLDVEGVELFAQAVGREIGIENGRDLFIIGRTMCRDNVFTGPASLTLHDGDYYVLMCGVEIGEDDELIATTDFTVEGLTINTSGDDEPELEPLTFTVDIDNEGFTVTPSDDVQEYFAVVFTPGRLEQLEGMMLNVEGFMRMSAGYGACFGYTFTGTNHFTFEEYLDRDEELVDGRYVIAVMGLRPMVDYHVITTEIYQYEWILDNTTTGIRDIESAVAAAKMLKDGKFIFNGRVGLDGTLVR